MGREVRRVPPNWEHPKSIGKYDTKENYAPLYDKGYDAAAREWLARCHEWENGTDPYLITHPEEKIETPYFWDWDGMPPDKEHYRPDWPEGTATWWQAYETVSEGTPVSPPFATPEELTDYLCTKGDFWAQSRGERPPTRAQAEAFVRGGWAPSMLVESGPAGVKVMDSYEAMDSTLRRESDG